MADLGTRAESLVEGAQAGKAHSTPNMAVNRGRIIIKSKTHVKMTEKISLYNTVTSSQRDYLLALRNTKMLCSSLRENICYFSRQGLHLVRTVKQCIETTYLANRFW